jgi:hypothetical protein
MTRHCSGAVSFQKEIATMSKPKRLHAVDLRASWARLTPQTVLLLDGSIVLNFGTSNESRRYITPISRTEYLSYANQQTPGPFRRKRGRLTRRGR